MTRWTIGAALAALAAAATAQEASFRLDASRDSDRFRELHTSAGYRAAAGFGLEAASRQYRAPGWGENGALLAATYRRQLATLQIDARLGALHLAERQRAVAAVDALWAPLDGSAVGLSFERDIVNSQAAIDAGVTQNTVALVADHAFTARFNVGLAAGATRFSNDNTRPFLRTRWNLEIVPDVGLNAYLKTRSYRNREPNQAEYFSPERLNEVSAGLSSRFVVTEGLVLALAADLGRQHTEAGSQRIWSYTLRLASPRRSALQWSVGLQASTAAGTSQADASASYRYTSAVAQLSVPF